MFICLLDSLLMMCLQLLVGSKKCVVYQETQPYSAVVMQVARTTHDNAMLQIRNFFTEYKI